MTPHVPHGFLSSGRPLRPRDPPKACSTPSSSSKLSGHKNATIGALRRPASELKRLTSSEPWVPHGGGRAPSAGSAVTREEFMTEGRGRRGELLCPRGPKGSGGHMGCMGSARGLRLPRRLRRRHGPRRPNGLQRLHGPRADPVTSVVLGSGGPTGCGDRMGSGDMATPAPAQAPAAAGAPATLWRSGDPVAPAPAAPWVPASCCDARAVLRPQATPGAAAPRAPKRPPGLRTAVDGRARPALRSGEDRASRPHTSVAASASRLPGPPQTGPAQPDAAVRPMAIMARVHRNPHPASEFRRSASWAGIWVSIGQIGQAHRH